MATTTTEHTGNGVKGGAGSASNSSNRITLSFPVLKTEDIKVSLNGKTLATTEYTYDATHSAIEFKAITGTPTTFQSNTQETSTGAPKTGVKILIYRDTDVDAS